MARGVHSMEMRINACVPIAILIIGAKKIQDVRKTFRTWSKLLDNF